MTAIPLQGNGRSLGSIRLLLEADDGNPLLKNVKIQEKTSSGWLDYELDNPANANELVNLEAKLSDVILTDETVQAAIAQYVGASSGATTVANITDASAEAKTFLLASGLAALRAALGLGTAATADAGDFAAAVHTHAIADTTGLQAALDAKAAASHSHPAADLPALNALTAPTGAVAMNGQKITGGAPGTVDTDFVTKSQLDALAQGLDPKASVRVGTTANIALSGAQTIDGVAVIAGDRVLVKNQSTPSENGIYVAAAGAWSRATDADTWDELVGAYTLITAGTQANSGWVSQAASTGTLGDPVAWAQFSASGGVSAFNGRTGSITPTSGDYTAAQITETSVAKIMTDVERTKLSGIATAATANSADATLLARANHTGTQAIATVAGLQAAIDGKEPVQTPISQADAEAGTGTVVRSWTAERVKQAILALASIAGGGAGNITPQSGSAAVAVATTEAQVGATATITPSSATARIKVTGFAVFTKDTGTTVRTVTLRIRRGTTNADPLVASNVAATPGVASEALTIPVGGSEVPGVTTPVSYTLRAIGATTGGTIVSYLLIVEEMGVGPKGDAGTIDAASVAAVVVDPVAAAGVAAAQAQYGGLRSVLEAIPRAEWAAIVAGTSTYDATADILSILTDKKRVYLPAGTYRINSSLSLATTTMTQGWELLGAGAYNTIIKPVMSSGHALSFSGTNETTPANTFQYGTQIRNLTLDGSACTGTAGGLRTVASWRTILDKITIKNFPGDGIYAPALTGNVDAYISAYWRLLNCVIEHCGGWGINNEARLGWGNTFLQHCYVNWNLKGGVRWTGSGLTINSCGIAWNGSPANGGGGLLLDGEDGPYNGHDISQVEFDGNFLYHVHCGYTRGVRLRDNRYIDRILALLTPTVGWTNAAYNAVRNPPVNIEYGDKTNSRRASVIEETGSIVRWSSDGTTSKTPITHARMSVQSTAVAINSPDFSSAQGNETKYARCGGFIGQAVRTGAAITSVTVLHPGEGYDGTEPFLIGRTDNAMVPNGGGTGATATFAVDAHGKVTSVTVTAGGSGYTTTPAVGIVPVEHYNLPLDTGHSIITNGLNELSAYNNGAVTVGMATGHTVTVGQAIVPFATYALDIYGQYNYSTYKYTATATCEVLVSARIRFTGLAAGDWVEIHLRRTNAGSTFTVAYQRTVFAGTTDAEAVFGPEQLPVYKGDLLWIEAVASKSLAVGGESRTNRVLYSPQR